MKSLDASESMKQVEELSGPLKKLMKYVKKLDWFTIWDCTIMLLIYSWAQKNFVPIGLLVIENNNNEKAHAIWPKC
jgi:hypothetical protein